MLRKIKNNSSRSLYSEFPYNLLSLSASPCLVFIPPILLRRRQALGLQLWSLSCAVGHFELLGDVAAFGAVPFAGQQPVVLRRLSSRRSIESSNRNDLVWRCSRTGRNSCFQSDHDRPNNTSRDAYRALNSMASWNITFCSLLSGGKDESLEIGPFGRCFEIERSLGDDRFLVGNEIALPSSLLKLFG